MEQYPHYLFINVLGGSTQNDDGTWTTTDGGWLLVSICREEPNGGGNVVNQVDGQATDYSSKVYLPVSTPSISEGSEIRVCSTNSADGQVRISGRVIRFSKGQLNARLWV